MRLHKADSSKRVRASRVAARGHSLRTMAIAILHRCGDKHYSLITPCKRQTSKMAIVAAALRRGRWLLGRSVSGR